MGVGLFKICVAVVALSKNSGFDMYQVFDTFMPITLAAEKPFGGTNNFLSMFCDWFDS